jgi:hypothetical protein
MAPPSGSSACDRRSYATLVGHRMGDQIFLSRAPSCFGRHVKALVPAAFAVVSTQQSAWWVMARSLYGLCPSSGGINRLMMILFFLYIS